MTRYNVKLRKEIIQTKTQRQKIQTENPELRKFIIQIRAKQQQKQTKCVKKTYKINKINDELKYPKRKLTELTRKLEIQKEKNIKSNKKFEDQKNEREKQITALKTINLYLENKINNKSKNTEQSTDKQD